jgi:membrane fusion protein, multidrug efflux system
VGAWAFVAAACQGAGNGAGSADAGPMVVGPESLAVAQKEVIAVGPRIAGQLEPQRKAQVRAEVGGSVTEVKAELGQQVKEGQLLVRIEEGGVRDAFRSAQAAVKSAENDLDVARRQVERSRKLVEAGALAKTDFETAQSTAAGADARLADARARLAQARKQLDATSVNAPIGGIVSERAVSEGDVVAPGTPLFTVIDPSSMRLDASVPSDQLSALKVGTPVQFQVRGYPDQTFQGKIEGIAPAADPVTRQIPILVSIPNPESRLVSNLFAEGQVAADQREALMVPLSAVDETGPTPTVTRVRDGRTERVAVKLGVRDERTERVEVSSGLSPNDRVLTGAARGIAPGTQVRLVSKQTSSAP